MFDGIHVYGVRRKTVLGILPYDRVETVELGLGFTRLQKRCVDKLFKEFDIRIDGTILIFLGRVGMPVMTLEES